MKTDKHLNLLTKEVISSAIEVHRTLGPGLLESAYQECLATEFSQRGIVHFREYGLSLEYKGTVTEKTYYLDFLIEGSVPLEIKSIDAVHPIHLAQLLTYLKIGKWKVGLLINFNEQLLTDGVHRRVLGFKD